MAENRTFTKTVLIISCAITIIYYNPHFSYAQTDVLKNKVGILLETSTVNTATNIPKLNPFFPSEIIPIVNLDAYGTYSNSDSGDDVWGASISGSASPVMKFNDKLYVVPLYEGLYGRQKFFVHVEEGGREYNEVQHHDLSATVKWLATHKITLSPFLFGGLDLNVETNDEEWGDGLYDYGEFGSGCDFDYLLYETSIDRATLSLGGKWYAREYPNYKTLISLASTTAPEKNEKDFDAVELSTGYNYLNRENFSAKLKYILLMKFFTDKKVIDPDGILESEKRREYRNSVRIESSYSPTPGTGFQYSLASEFAYNTGNQNFYDSRGTVVLTDDVFTPNYFDYISFEINPTVSYIFKSGDKTIAALSGSYDLLVRQYTDRKTQLAGGIYTQDEERDYVHTFETKLQIPFDEHISWITSYEFSLNKSNMDYETYYEYAYTMHRVLAGISLSY